VHNTQPWRFRVDGPVVHLRADRTRGLAVNDPYDRELTMSCGAALCNLEVSAAARGLRSAVTTFPDPSDPDVLATVEVAGRADAPAPADTDRALAGAIASRHTYRGRFADAPMPAGLEDRLLAAGEGEQVRLIRIDTPDDREDLAAVVADADRTQFGDPHWRRELAIWMHPDRQDDGMPLPRGSDLGTRLAPTAPGEPIEVDDPDRSLVLDAPLVVVLASAGDRPPDWLRAGRVLQRVLLVAAAEGIQASYLNQACQVTSARNGVRYLVGGEPHPQAILRFGVPARSVRRTTRRPLADVLEGA
jgi:hypothetical protein